VSTVTAQVAADVIAEYFALRLVGLCGRPERHKKRSSVCPSVCPVDRQQRRPAGLLLRTDTGSRYRSTAAGVARHAGRVNFGLTVRRSFFFFFTVSSAQGRIQVATHEVKPFVETLVKSQV